VDVIGRYTHLHHQGERLQELLKMVPAGPSEAISRTFKQVQRRLRGAEIDELVAGYLAGGTVYELARHFGVHRHTVSEILERSGVARRYQKLSPEQLDTACSLYRSGFSLTRIGHQLDRPAETIRQALIRAGVEIRPRNGSRQKS